MIEWPLLAQIIFSMAIISLIRPMIMQKQMFLFSKILNKAKNVTKVFLVFMVTIMSKPDFINY